MCHRILECVLLTGTWSAEGIMASGHVNRAKRPNTWPHRPAAEVKKALANREPSTHGTFRKCHLRRLRAALGSKADSSKPPQAIERRGGPEQSLRPANRRNLKGADGCSGYSGQVSEY